MYRLIVVFGDDLDDAKAEEFADKVATVADEFLGVPLTDDDSVTYILTYEPDVDSASSDEWLKTNVFREGVRGVIIPRPYAEKLQ